MSEATELRAKVRQLIERWEKFADTDHSVGMRLSDARKEGQRQLLMAGQALAYATAAKELRALLASSATPTREPTSEAIHQWADTLAETLSTNFIRNEAPVEVRESGAEFVSALVDWDEARATPKEDTDGTERS